MDPSLNITADATTGVPADNTESTRVYTITTFVGSLTMIILCAMGLYTNVISWIIFVSKSMRSSINILLGALSMIDFMVILLAVPVFVLPGLDEYANFNFVNKYYSIVILYLYPFAMIAQTASIWTFVVISVERYYAVCFPLEANRRLTIGRAKFSQLLVIVFSVLYNLIRFWEYKPNKFFYDRSADQVIPLLRENPTYFLVYYVIFYLATHFIVPFMLISYLNVRIFMAIRQAMRYRKCMEAGIAGSNGNLCGPNVSNNVNNSVSSSTSISNSNSNNGSQRTFNYGKTRMVIVVTLIFLVCNFFTFVLNVWEACQPTLFHSRHVTWAFLLLDLSNIGVILNSSTNFIVYLIYCSKYRRLFFLYFQCNCRAVPEGANFVHLSEHQSWRRAKNIVHHRTHSHSHNHKHSCVATHVNRFVARSLQNNCKRAYSIV